MIDASLSLEAAEGLKGADLLPYLAAKGWTVRPSRVEGISVLSKQLPDAERPAELILPVIPGFMDEHRRVADALRTLAQIEGLPETSVADDVRRAASHSAVPLEVNVPQEVANLLDWPTLSQFRGFLSDVEIESAAQRLRKNLGVSDEVFNIVFLLEREMPRIITDFRFEVIAENQLEESVEAYSRVFPPRILVRNDIRSRAVQGEPRSRFTIAHELAHLWLRTESPRFSRGGSPQEIRMRARAEEAQASKFAAAFLMPMHVVDQIRDPVKLSIRCNVSLEAAKFRMTLLYRMPQERRGTALPMRTYGFLHRVLSNALRKLS